MGSAITTCGCSVFLLACTLAIFQKLGGVVLAVTLMSILTALGPLPAALLVCGPLQPGRRCSFSSGRAGSPGPASQEGVASSGSRSPTFNRTAGMSAPATMISPSSPMPGDGIILASAVVAQNARSRRPSWANYQTTPFKEFAVDGFESPFDGTPASLTARQEGSPASPTSVHIEVMDSQSPDFTVHENERGLATINERSETAQRPVSRVRRRGHESNGGRLQSPARARE